MALQLVLDSRDPLPLYAQLERGIKRAIAGGSLPVGDKLPTVRQLAVELKINANTVARVYAELERQNVLITRRGVGTFVAETPPPALVPKRQRAAELRALAERLLADAAAQGFSPEDLRTEFERLVPKS